MFNWLAKLKHSHPRTTYELARTSYGNEPYRTPAEISASERALAVMDGDIRGLLRQVIGIEAMRQLPETLHSKKFRELLPTTKQNLLDRVIELGLPPRLASYTDPDRGDSDNYIYQRPDMSWGLISIDERLNKIEEIFPTKQEAELRVIAMWMHVFTSELVNGK
ncbi:MAG: hypothetical protein ABL877_01105 [Thiobacillus sp.]